MRPSPPPVFSEPALEHSLFPNLAGSPAYSILALIVRPSEASTASFKGPVPFSGSVSPPRTPASALASVSTPLLSPNALVPNPGRWGFGLILLSPLISLGPSWVATWNCR